ncbi:MAG: hypothetical protein JSS34_03100 [Proteobacteria bacterium]|nr:hypothetical protein [Pseudomonadota bacterium]
MKKSNIILITFVGSIIFPFSAFVIQNTYAIQEIQQRASEKEEDHKEVQGYEENLIEALVGWDTKDK